ncbi:BTAD domain-containing putative transcriptional regulator [Spirillospora sp. NPDC047279]|uniref:BTAD domain-containing putative transcriptional regulator n=1 Tax=Spirillospora sp. NPDC047279 TaxID=3155478 RepID=UPI0033C2E704
MRSLRFEILGRPRAWGDDEELDLGPGKQRAVLAVLLVNANRPVSVPSIVDAVWGDEPPDNGSNVVQKYVAGLRRVLEPDRSPRSPGEMLTLSPAGYVLHVGPDGLDAELFQRDVRAALAVRSDAPAEAAARLRAALAMWREEALAGLRGPVFDAARDRLGDQRASALEACAEIELELGRHEALVPELTLLVADFPLRERLRYLLMLALYRCGRQPEALAAYRAARTFLDEEFGVEPGERLQDLHLKILRSDPALTPDRPIEDRRTPSSRPPEWVVSPRRPEWVSPSAAPAAASAGASAVGSAAAAVSAPVDFAPPSAPVDTPPGPAAPSGWTPAPVAFPLGHPAPVAAPAERHGIGLPAQIALVAVPLLTCGTAGWTVPAFLAARRRSLVLALSAAAYLALASFFMVVLVTSGPDGSNPPWDGPAIVAVIVASLGAAVQIAVVTMPDHGPAHGRAAAAAEEPPDPLMVDLVERRTRREQARTLTRHHPAIARELQIGRPDLPRTFDDGGLVDVNSVPEHVLANLRGIGQHEARLIVAVRESEPYASAEDLIIREVLPAHVVHALHETLIAVPHPRTTGE